jgi:Heterokaryon incompatibility protein (HET)
MSSSISYSANRSPCEIYSPLQTSQWETRLVTLQPGLTHELTRCTLSTVSLSAVHDEYEALSYVWGYPLIRENIELDAVEFQVTTNLHAALRHLRWVTRPRSLWIDAVCINQTNPAERSKQVSLMTEIYKHAKQVIVWLGESSHDSLRAMYFLDIIAQKPSQEFLSENPIDGNNPLAVFNRTGIGVQPLRMAEKPPQDEFLVEAAMNLLKRPWFQRGWVFQEVVLASKALVYCGQRSISWDDLSLAVRRITEIGATDIRVKQLSRLKEAPERSVLEVTELREIREYGLCRITLLYLLQRGIEREVTDPRDRIYAVLGLTSESLDNFPPPDYTQSVSEVYRNTVLYLIRHTGKLDVLNQVLEPKQEPGEPSWVPNWNKDFMYSWLRSSPGEEDLF